LLAQPISEWNFKRSSNARQNKPYARSTAEPTNTQAEPMNTRWLSNMNKRLGLRMCSSLLREIDYLFKTFAD